jgi:hypothetical protein
MRSLACVALAAGLLLTAECRAQDAANGESLYFQYCNVCHGFPPVGGPQHAGNKPDMIRAAIEIRVARMRILSFLTDAQLADIAAFIARVVDGEPRPTRDYTGLWFDPAQSGWGLKVAQHVAPRDAIFALLFVYDAAGRPVFLSLPAGTWTAPATFGGTLYATSGPAPTQAFDPAKVATRAVGTMTLAFESANAATLTYSVDGAAFVRRISRFDF